MPAASAVQKLRALASHAGDHEDHATSDRDDSQDGGKRERLVTGVA
jgi:hypothetical protein